MPIDAPLPQPSVNGAAVHGSLPPRAPVGPARAAVARLLRDQGAAVLQFRRAAVYLPGLLGGPRLFATSRATAPESDLSELAGEQPVSPLRLAAVRAASGGLVPFEIELGANRGEPAGVVIVVPLEGEGWLVAQRDEGWPPEERVCALALARTIHRVLVGG